MNTLQICPLYLGKSKKVISQHYYLYSSDYFRYLRRKQIAVYLLLFSASCYLHSPSAASGALYRRSTCIDTDMLRLAATACCDMGWISAQRGVLCEWSVSRNTGSMYKCRRWSLWTLAVTLLAWHSGCHTTWLVLFRATDDNLQLAPFRASSVWKCKQTVSEMKKFCNSQVNLVTFSGGVGKWITVCFLLINNTVENDFLDFPGKVATSDRWGGQICEISCDFFQDLTCQKSLKLVNFWQSYSNKRKVDVFWGHSVYMFG